MTYSAVNLKHIKYWSPYTKTCIFVVLEMEDRLWLYLTLSSTSQMWNKIELAIWPQLDQLKAAVEITLLNYHLSQHNGRYTSIKLAIAPQNICIELVMQWTGTYTTLNNKNIKCTEL